MDRRTKVTILQANLGRGRNATDEILQVANELNSPLLLIQEPYTNGSSVVGFGKYTNIVLTGNKPDEKPWACIVVLDKRYTAVFLRHLSSAHCVCAQITGPHGAFYVVELSVLGKCRRPRPPAAYRTQCNTVKQDLSCSGRQWSLSPLECQSE